MENPLSGWYAPTQLIDITRSVLGIVVLTVQLFKSLGLLTVVRIKANNLAVVRCCIA